MRRFLFLFLVTLARADDFGLEVGAIKLEVPSLRPSGGTTPRRD